MNPLERQTRHVGTGGAGVSAGGPGGKKRYFKWVWYMMAAIMTIRDVMIMAVFILIFSMNRMTVAAARNNKTRRGGKRSESKRSGPKRRAGAQTHRRSTRGSLKVPDIRSPAQLKEFSKLLTKANIVLVFIYADWCPHCHTYRDDVWNKLKATPGRNMAMAAVNSDIADSALNGFVDSATRQPAKADGYPTVILVENGTKEAVKIEDARNMPAMSRLVNNANNLGSRPGPAPKAVAAAPTITSPNNIRENTTPIETYSESIENAGNAVVAAAIKESPLRATENQIASPLALGNPENPSKEDLGEMLNEVEPPATGAPTAASLAQGAASLVQRGGSLLNALRAYERANRGRRYDLQ